MPEWISSATHTTLTDFDGVGFYEWRLLDDQLRWSPGLLKIYGLDRAPRSEPEFTALVHPDDRTRVEAETSTFLGQGQSYAHEFRIVRPDGEIRVVHDRGIIERGADGRAHALRGINIDITGQTGERGADRSADEKLRVAAGAGRFGLYDLEVQAERAYWSPSLLTLLGQEEAGTAASFSRALSSIHPFDRERIEAEMTAALGRVGPYHFSYRIQRPDGGVLWVADRGETFGPLDPATGRARRAVGILEDITEAKLFEKKFRENEERLELAYSVSGIAAFDVDLVSNTSFWSPNLYKLLGLSGDEPASPDLFFRHVHPDDLTGLRQSYDAAIVTGSLFNHEFRIIREDGEMRYVVGKGQVVREVDGVPMRLIGVNYDITDRKTAEERMELLMHEVAHREKNMLALVQSIARQTRNGDHEVYLENLTARIQSLAASQSLLIGNAWKGITIDDLARSQLGHFSDLIGSRLMIDGPSMTVAPSVGQTLGMALHELATNAAKYGALSNAHGRVELTWRRDATDGAEPRFSMLWRERDGPRVEAPERSGFGTTILDRMVRSVLDASVELSYLPDGLSWRIECPEARLYAGMNEVTSDA